MTATKLRIIMIAILALAIIGIGAGVWWVHSVLTVYVIGADHAKIDAQLSDLDLNKLRKLQSDLKDKQEIVARADQIAANASNYQYQDQVVSDLTTYAGRRGIKISAFNFNAGNSTQGSEGPAGTTLTAFTITLVGPIDYNTFLQFLYDVENNLTKIQVTSLSLAPDQSNPKLVTNPSLSLVVYLKK